MVEANHLSAAELHAAMGTAEMPPLGGGDGGGVVRPPGPNTAGDTVGVSPPGMSNMVPQMTNLPPHGSMLLPSFTGGGLLPNVPRVSPPRYIPNTLPHPVPAGGVSLQQFAAMYPPTPTQQFPSQFHHPHQAARFPQSNLSHEVQMQLQNRQQAASQRFLSSNATDVFAQAETMHLMAVKRVHIDKMKKEMMDDGGMNSAVSTSATPCTGASADGMAAMQEKNKEHLEAAASMAAMEALNSAATAKSKK